MTETELKSILERVGYKPGATVAYDPYYQPSHEFFHCVASITALDATDRISPIVVRQSFSVPRRAKEGDVVRYVFNAFAALENHECRELFGYRGVRIYDPHL